jgi:mannose-6-phosphate isomerase
VERLVCTTRDYAWGSRTLIPRFLGVEPDGRPQAEMWVGAHPGAPSQLLDGTPLDRHVRELPESTLGPEVAARFGPRLPFLMKALAAAEPLSLQVHPTAAQARAGFDQEEAAAANGRPRNYLDSSHKPELVYALTRFEGMAGFRDVEKSSQILRHLGRSWADETADRLLDGPADRALHDVVADTLAMPHDALQSVLDAVGRAAQGAEDRSHRGPRRSPRLPLDRTSVEREATRVFALTWSLAERYPSDPGVLVALLLNHVVLAPGEAMFLDAGVVHAYTSGFGIEIMASSDNVVRAGLTPKHVDVDELLRIASFTPTQPPLWPAEEVATGGLRSFAPPVDDFVLHVGKVPAGPVAGPGPKLVLALDGTLEVRTDRQQETVVRGQALFVAHDDGPVTVAGEGRVAIGAVPDPG